MPESLRPAVHGGIGRVAVLSVHTSPLAQPGSGDAGGMNVYIAQTARRLAMRGVQVDIFTRATSSDQPDVVPMAPGVSVRYLAAGPFDALGKDELPAQLCAFTAGVLRATAPTLSGGPAGRRYDVVHSHYWLSGQVGYLVRGRWGIPLVHSAHTLGRVKNAALADGDVPESSARLIGEQQVVDVADLLLAGTGTEAAELIGMYGADPARVAVIPPGVDTEVFAPGNRAADRAALGLDPQAIVIVFAGRIQPHKGPAVLVRAVAALRRRYPGRHWQALLVGGSSGSDHREPAHLLDLAAGLGVLDIVRLVPPLPARRLAAVFRAADVVAVPSHSESFGLVALEAQAAGTPVVAAAVGGLPIVVADGVSGLLVPGHDTAAWADALARVVLDPARRAAMAAAGPVQAARFSWEATVDGLLAAYRRAAHGRGWALGARPEPVARQRCSPLL